MPAGSLPRRTSRAPREVVMAKIVLEKLAHSYNPRPTGENDFALRQIDMAWEQGGAYALLGPSGCGKTTLLNLVAGFLIADHGEIFIEGALVTDVPTFERDIGMIFQNYALFPHMTVAANIAYGLKTRGIAREEIAARVAEMLSLMKLAGLEGRRPRERPDGFFRCSGRQQIYNARNDSHDVQPSERVAHKGPSQIVVIHNWKNSLREDDKKYNAAHPRPQRENLQKSKSRSHVGIPFKLDKIITQRSYIA